MKRGPYKKSRSEYFPYGTNNWLIRALLYSHQKAVRTFSESCRKLRKYHPKPNFVRIKPETLALQKLSVSHQQTADDSSLTTY